MRRVTETYMGQTVDYSQVINRVIRIIILMSSPETTIVAVKHNLLLPANLSAYGNWREYNVMKLTPGPPLADDLPSFDARQLEPPFR